MKKLFLLSLVLLIFKQGVVLAEEFPGRTKFPDVKTIELTELTVKLQQMTVVDVRSAYEFNTLRIMGAKNIPVADRRFKDKIAALRSVDDKPFVFYCNGKTCLKSYQAARQAEKAGVSNVLSFDAGIFAWAQANPNESELLGKAPVAAGQLISKEDLEKHMLEPKKFAEKAMKNAIIIDIRDRFQRDGVELFAGQQKNVPLDNEKLQKYVDQAKRNKKALFIVDAVGKQVRWLQYFLEEQNVDYYFMKGGAKAFFDDLLSNI